MNSKTITFANGFNMDYLQAFETEEYYNGANRRTLTFTCSKDAIGMDALNTLISNEANVQDIELHVHEDATKLQKEVNAANIYSGYVLKLTCGMEQRMVSTETTEAPAKYEDFIVFKLGKRTYTEEALHKMGIM